MDVRISYDGGLQWTVRFVAWLLPPTHWQPATAAAAAAAAVAAAQLAWYVGKESNRDVSYGHLGRSIRYGKYALSTECAYNKIVCLSFLEVPIFDPKWTRFGPISLKTIPILFQYVICYFILFKSIGSSQRPLLGRKLPKKAPKRQKMANRAIV